VTVKQAAARMEVSIATIYALVGSGKLKCHRIGVGRGCIRIAEEHVADYLRGAEPITTTPIPPPRSRIVKLKHLRSN
jgi:excisionase family DNA binding protein